VSIAPGDRVRYDGDGDYVRVGSEWWPGRVGYVIEADGRRAAVLWVDDGTQSTLPVNRLRLDAPERFCQMCKRNVYLAYAAMSGALMEWVPGKPGEVTILHGRAVTLEVPEADRQMRQRRALQASDEINRLTAHWRVCKGSPKYLDVPLRRGTRRETARYH